MHDRRGRSHCLSCCVHTVIDLCVRVCVPRVVLVGLLVGRWVGVSVCVVCLVGLGGLCLLGLLVRSLLLY